MYTCTAYLCFFCFLHLYQKLLSKIFLVKKKTNSLAQQIKLNQILRSTLGERNPNLESPGWSPCVLQDCHLDAPLGFCRDRPRGRISVGLVRGCCTWPASS